MSFSSFESATDSGDVDTFSDYSDYSYWYDVAYAAAGYDFASYFYDNAGDPIDFSQYIEGKDRYKRYAHELRFSTPADQPSHGPTSKSLLWARASPASAPVQASAAAAAVSPRRGRVELL